MSDVSEPARTHRLRYSGVLMHPTSLPGRYGIGDLGRSAFDFIDFLDRAGQSLWQVLPLGPTGYGDSPYQPFSAFAGQPLIISPDLLIRDGLLKERDLAVRSGNEEFSRIERPVFSEYLVEYDRVSEYKSVLLQRAYREFRRDQHGLKEEFDSFLDSEKTWLDDYALFMSLKDANGSVSWHQWIPEHRNAGAGSPEEKAQLYRQYQDDVMYYCFVQFIFFRQWNAVKKYANDKGISIIGDIPIFVSPDSADVWANRKLFKLDRDGVPTEVAGVPPDYFSETGQLWGNPLYNWREHRKDGYSWWTARIGKQLEMFDYVRIDHFRGFEAYWAVPYGNETAIDGKWVKGPGAGLFQALQNTFGRNMPIIAEDLGIITEKVDRLRQRFGFPGMKVLQFAFEGDDESDYIPYLYDENCICYTGTHDNDTSLGWYMSTSEENRDRARQYMMCSGWRISWDFIRTAAASTARYAVYPMQDILGYGGDCRMNVPGTPSGNWRWRCRAEAVTDELADELKELCTIYGRDKDRLNKLREAD